jgi:hypothetical protein
MAFRLLTNSVSWHSSSPGMALRGYNQMRLSNIISLFTQNCSLQSRFEFSPFACHLPHSFAQLAGNRRRMFRSLRRVPVEILAHLLLAGNLEIGSHWTA